MDTAASEPDPAPDGSAPVVAVFSRYGGVVVALTEVLARAGLAVARTWACDGNPPTSRGHGGRVDPATPPPGLLRELLQGIDVVVCTFAPGDPTWPALRAVPGHAPVVAVVWHPDAERDDEGLAAVVPTGRVRAELAAAVRAAAASVPAGRPQASPSPTGASSSSDASPSSSTAENAEASKRLAASDSRRATSAPTAASRRRE